MAPAEGTRPQAPTRPSELPRRRSAHDEARGCSQDSPCRVSVSPPVDDAVARQQTSGLVRLAQPIPLRSVLSPESALPDRRSCTSSDPSSRGRWVRDLGSTARAAEQVSGTRFGPHLVLARSVYRVLAAVLQAIALPSSQRRARDGCCPPGAAIRGQRPPMPASPLDQRSARVAASGGSGREAATSSIASTRPERCSAGRSERWSGWSGPWIAPERRRSCQMRS
jgi:hypothetical protein